MNTVAKKTAFPLFIVVAVVQLLSILFEWEQLRFVSKPLLMPLLMLAVYANTEAGRGRHTIILALFFSFLGDTFLLYDYKNASFFIIGLVCFLITHIIYIIYFLSLKPAKVSFLKTNWWIVLLVAGYGIALVWFLYPSLGPLKIPVLVYALVICSMLLSSIHIYPRVKWQVGQLFIAGAFFFVLSDSLLAINKFSQPFPFAGVAIMLTYCLAQYCIAKGFVQSRSM